MTTIWHCLFGNAKSAFWKFENTNDCRELTTAQERQDYSLLDRESLVFTHSRQKTRNIIATLAKKPPRVLMPGLPCGRHYQSYCNLQKQPIKRNDRDGFPIQCQTLYQQGEAKRNWRKLGFLRFSHFQGIGVHLAFCVLATSCVVLGKQSGLPGDVVLLRPFSV